ncbi:MAG: XrtA/PEP-CTERM system amidotransferase [Rhodospirillaceae bacterium]
MCGICGIFDLKDQRPIPPKRVQAMASRVAHRGPDGGGTYAAPGVMLAHHRLAVIDLADGRQPMVSDNGRHVIVYNGEIYNYKAIAASLTALGHHFRTHSDTEVILHAWAEWGEDCLEYFHGMFAFALWDVDRGTLFLARDRLGEKPLYYGVTADGLFLFGSELGAVVAGLGAAPALDPAAIEEYFAFGYVPDPRTIFQGVFKLPPGHRLTLGPGRGVTPVPYWDVHFAPDESRSFDSWAEDLAERLVQAVRGRLCADVPLGAFLSGGIDSSGVVAAMAGASPRPVQTCTIGFRDPHADESVYAQLIAERFHTDHVNEIVDIDVCGLIERLATIYGEPFADSSALPTYALCRLARQRVTIALSGDGGDEVFAGYRRHAFHWREEQIKGLLPSGLRSRLFGKLAQLYPRLDWAPRFLRAKATLEALSSDAVEGYFRAVTITPCAVRSRLYSADLRHRLAGYQALEVLRGHAARAGTLDPLARIQYLDLKTWLPGGMLTKIDRASMAVALEVRAPFLDHTLVEWAATLPSKAKVKGFSGKAVLKRALEPVLPREILYRPKRGFSPPLSRWLHQGLDERLSGLVTGSPLAGSGLFDPTAIAGLIAQHRAGWADHSRTLWALLMFDAFLRQTWS